MRKETKETIKKTGKEISKINTKIKIVFIGVLVLIIVVASFLGIEKLVKKQKPGPLPLSDRAVELFKIKRFSGDCREVIRKAEEFIKTGSEKDADIWRLKGSCEFRLKKYKEARDSFNNVLKLKPDDQASNIYLKNIEKALSGKVVFVNPLQDELNQDYVESKIGFSFDKKNYTFFEGIALTPANESPERFTASYASKLSFEQTKNDIRNKLKTLGTSFKEITQNGKTIFVVRFKKSKDYLKGYSISISNVPEKKSVNIAIFYEK